MSKKRPSHKHRKTYPFFPFRARSPKWGLYRANGIATQRAQRSKNSRFRARLKFRARTKFSSEPPTPVLPFLAFFFVCEKRQGKPAKKQGFVYANRTPKIPGKEAKNAQNNKEFPAEEKKQGIPKKQGKEGQGRGPIFFCAEIDTSRLKFLSEIKNLVGVSTPKKIFSAPPPPKIPQFAADTLPAPPPLPPREPPPPLWDFQ